MADPPRRIVVTGAPGAGKTSMLAELQRRGHSVIGEAATDINAEMMGEGTVEPWRAPDFLDRIVTRQLDREDRSGPGLHLLDRSVFCTLALAGHLGRAITPALQSAVEHAAGRYADAVLFVRPLGFMTPTEIRRISYQDSLAFQKVHEQVYREHGFELIDIPPLDPAARADLVGYHLRSHPGLSR